MKHWQRRAAAVLLGSLVPLLFYGSARAQDDDNAVSILSDILVPILVIIDKILDYWVNGVTGNSLTDPWGTSLVESLATYIQQMIKFFAQFSLLLPANSIS